MLKMYSKIQFIVWNKNSSKKRLLEIHTRNKKVQFIVSKVHVHCSLRSCVQFIVIQGMFIDQKSVKNHQLISNSSLLWYGCAISKCKGVSIKPGKINRVSKILISSFVKCDHGKRRHLSAQWSEIWFLSSFKYAANFFMLEILSYDLYTFNGQHTVSNKKKHI